MKYNINELRRKFNKGTIEEQIKTSNEFIKAMNPGIKVFSESGSLFPPVDKLTKDEENHIKEGLLEANRLRKEGKL